MNKLLVILSVAMLVGTGCTRNIVSQNTNAGEPITQVRPKNRVQGNGYSFVLPEGMIAATLPPLDSAHVDDERLEIMEPGNQTDKMNNPYSSTSLIITERNSLAPEKRVVVFGQYLGPAFNHLKGYLVTTQRISANVFENGKWVPAPEDRRIVSFVKGPEKGSLQYYIIEPCQQCSILELSVDPLSNIAKNVPDIIKSLDFTYSTS